MLSFFSKPFLPIFRFQPLSMGRYFRLKIAKISAASDDWFRRFHFQADCFHFFSSINTLFSIDFRWWEVTFSSPWADTIIDYAAAAWLRKYFDWLRLFRGSFDFLHFYFISLIFFGRQPLLFRQPLRFHVFSFFLHWCGIFIVGPDLGLMLHDLWCRFSITPT